MINYQIMENFCDRLNIGSIREFLTKNNYFGVNEKNRVLIDRVLIRACSFIIWNGSYEELLEFNSGNDEHEQHEHEHEHESYCHICYYPAGNNFYKIKYDPGPEDYVIIHEDCVNKIVIPYCEKMSSDIENTFFA